MKPSDPIREYVSDKVGKVAKLLGETGEAHVVLSVEKRYHVAQIDLITAGAHRTRAEERGEDMYATIDQATDKLMTQVRRFRDKVRDRHREGGRGRELSHHILLPTRDAQDEIIEKPQVIRQETIFAREMNVDDAVIQMDLLNSDFLVFTDAISHQLHVMYRLPDGHYGLIEARQA